MGGERERERVRESRRVGERERENVNIDDVICYLMAC